MKNFFKKITCPIFSSKGRRLFEKAAGFACIVFSLSAFTSSCDSGLGSAVDTQAPVLVIETPSSREVKNGDVLVGGTWSDDKAVVKVTISVVLKSSTQGNAETESAESSNVSYLYENVEAVVKSDKTWQYVFATNTSEETEGRKVRPDGKYDITVHADFNRK